jgi:hypothetical protein
MMHREIYIGLEVSYFFLISNRTEKCRITYHEGLLYTVLKESVEHNFFYL